MKIPTLLELNYGSRTGLVILLTVSFFELQAMGYHNPIEWGTLDNERIFESPEAVVYEGVGDSVADTGVRTSERRDIARIVFGQQLKVSGTITDTGGQPLPGASIVEKGTSNGTQTDFDGNFSLELTDGNAILIVSYIGFATQEITVDGRDNISAALEESAAGLDEVVVVGFGTQKKVNLTGAVATMGSENLENRPVTNVSSALQGQMPGVTVLQSSGEPGRDGASIRIRGVGTMNNANPMVLVDGIESSMDDVNPNDIDNISVLKDAASAAIYGTRAANGVILITTKRGKVGKPSFSYRGYTGVQKPTYTPEFLNSYEYAKLRNEGLVNEGATPQFSDSDLEKLRTGSDPVNFADTDWMDLLYRGSGMVQSHDISVSGGTENTKYLVSLGYFNQEGIVKNTNFDRYNLRVNLDTKVSKAFTLGLNTSISQREIFRPNGDFFVYPHRTPPNISVKLADGSWNHYFNNNPIAIIEEGGKHTTKDTHVLTTLFGVFTIAKGLTLKGVLAADFNFDDQSRHTKQFTWGDGTNSGANSIENELDRSRNITSQAILNYKEDFGAHSIDFLAGASQESFTRDFDGLSRINLPNNELTEINAGSKEGQFTEGFGVESTLRSFFGRANYAFKDKYLFEANLRYDGSSKFAKSDRWGLFPSVSAAWRISQESFLSEASWLNNFKLRASWGKLGNHRIGDYEYIPKIATSVNYSFFDEVADGVAEVVAVNENLTWETNTSYNLGLDLSLLEGKVQFSADYYNRLTEDILTPVPVSQIFGLPAPLVNAGAMRNKGIEFVIGTSKIQGDFTYDLSFNIGFNDNNVEKYAKPDKSNDRLREEGSPWNAYYGYESIGFFQTDEEVLNDPKVVGAPIQKGDLKFKDQNDDGVINADDRVVLGSDIPGTSYGVNLSFGYKNFDLSMFGIGAADVYGLLNDQVEFPFVNGGKAQARHLDRWTPETPNAEYPITHINQWHNYEASSFNVRDASYFRLKNVQVGYNLSTAVLETLGVSKLRLYLSAENLFTISKFSKDFDPESPDNAWTNYTPVKIFSGGIVINL
ncbi:SusC/RagA family TonB-linked outer membrane protein [Zobellia galactanivorans]|uniref:TonB-dependent Transducer n=1 Tax=Zobellia galactanivorans (strain DSM 12802 / CCUG 47099 / CIP 106680 / NCIMB 13871 / Dsij) TaxID=63186 RepID=G0L0G0_ZOBGA|nr:TonB-dependent receptor [Zobellia galactanivorans]CAZ94386.1 TonB-dependent Transducer [Zobellia galactanivorans]